MWPLGALAELLDNSQDRECGSTKVEVEARVLNGKYALTVQDDGRGMTRSGLNKMLSFGFSDKEHVSGNVGRFGIGFKSGSMRLADDALILTKREGYAHAALLSQTFLDAVAADDILIPIFSFKVEEVGEVKYVPFEPSDQSEWISNALIFEQYSPFNPTSLAKELDKIGGPHGTRIILFNLRKRDDTESHLYELDFSVSNDIRIFGHTGENTNKHRGPVFQQHRGGQQATLDVPEDYSLRAYMEVLYLRPRCEFYLRGEKIVPRCPISRLTKEYYVFPEYKPKGFAHGIIVHCGYVEGNSKFCGFHIYNKNRLIRMYQRFASQLQANCMMKDMLGVIEADCVEPTHNKQAFKESALAYHRMKSHVTKCMNEYYFSVQQIRSAGKSGRERERIVSHAEDKSALGKKRKTMEQSKDVSVVTLTENETRINTPIYKYKILAVEQKVLITQLNAAQEKISEQHAQIEKLRALHQKTLKKAQVRNANRLNQSIEPIPKDIEVDATNIDTKELLQALQSATGKLEKQYTLLQLSRTREARLEVQLRAEKERAKKVQEILNLDSNKFVSEKQVEKVEQPRNKATTTATTNTGQKTREQTTPSKTQSLHVEKIPDFAQPEQSQQLHLPQLPLPPPQPLLSLPPPALEQSNTVIVTTASDILNQAFEGGSNTPSLEKTACLPTGSDESLQSPMKMVGVQQALHDDDEKHQVQSQSSPTAQYFVKKSGSSTKPKSKRVTIAPPESSLPRGMHSPAKVPRLEKLKQVIMRSPTVVCDKSGAREH